MNNGLKKLIPETNLVVGQTSNLFNSHMEYGLPSGSGSLLQWAGHQRTDRNGQYRAGFKCCRDDLANRSCTIAQTISELAVVTGRSDLTVALANWVSQMGYGNYFFSLVGGDSSNTIVSNWPTYLTEYFTTELNIETVAQGLIHDEQEGISYFQYDLLNCRVHSDTNGALETLIQSSNLHRGVGYLQHLNSGNGDCLLVLFNQSCANTDMEAPVRGLAGLNHKIAEKMSALQGAQGETRYKISKRELECIRWTAEGKTSYEISVILDLSENTVNNYIANAVKKLGGVNRAHMISIAIRSGVIG